jgi:hypothetical protein
MQAQKTGRNTISSDAGSSLAVVYRFGCKLMK